MPMFQDKNEFLRSARALGASEADAYLKRPEFIQQTAVATVDGVISTADAHDVWDAFDNNKKRNEKFGEVVVKSDKARKVRVSEINTVIKAAAMPMNGSNVRFPDVLNDARKVIVQAAKAGDYKGNTQDAFIKIARAQLKVEDRPLTDDEIYQAILPKNNTKDANEAKDLERAAKILKRIIEGSEGNENTPPREASPSEETEGALRLISERLAVLTLTAENNKAAAVLLRNGVVLGNA